MSINRQFGAFMRDLFAGNVEVRTDAENSGDGRVPILFVPNEAMIDPKGSTLTPDALETFERVPLTLSAQKQGFMHPRDLHLWTKAWPAVFAVYPEDEAPPMRIMKSKKWERRRSKPYAKRLIAMDAMCAQIMSVYDEEAKKDA